jgi:hypothetical protein
MAEAKPTRMGWADAAVAVSNVTASATMVFMSRLLA